MRVISSGLALVRMTCAQTPGTGTRIPRSGLRRGGTLGAHAPRPVTAARSCCLAAALGVARPGVAAITYTYDSSGRLATVRQTDDRIYTFAYDTSGRVQSITDPLGRATSFGYDAANRVTTQTLPGSRVITLAYDAGDNVTSLTPPGRPAHTMGFSVANLLDLYTAPESRGRSWCAPRGRAAPSSAA